MKMLNLGRFTKVAAAGVLATSLSGCLAAIAVPMVATTGALGASAASANNAVDFGRETQRMNCNQLRAEYAKLQANQLGRFSPFGSWASRRAAVQSAADQKGCQLPA